MDQQKVLIIDDDPDIINFVTAKLTAENYKVEGAGYGGELFEKMERFDPDLIILDIMLPDIDGVDLCAGVRERSNVPIIMLSARGELEVRVHTLLLGADDFTPKPFRGAELVARVEAVLRRSNVPSAGTVAAQIRAADACLASD